MCGIAGLVRFSGLRPDERQCGVHMATRLRHRGPDELGSYTDRWASLGHARLSVIDVQAGRQPMSNEDGRIQVIFNGEIYNHRDLAEQLRGRGHQLNTRCDTEIIAHLYEDHGPQFVHKLIGMFAIALWDAGRHQLLLIRDRMGIKPLYWHADGDRIAFGSELKAVLAAGSVSAQVDTLALKDYLTFAHVPAPRTIYRNIYKLEPGHMLTCTGSGPHLQAYWDIPFSADHDRAAEAHAASTSWQARFADELDEVVASHLESDVPLGAFLSGGVDSAAVVAAMTRHASGPVLTHTVGFEEVDHDERTRARSLARHLSTDHHELMVRHDAAGLVDQLITHFDEPFADPCALPALHLARAARQRVTVALAGDGPDEMLAGYRRYRFDMAEAAARALAPAWFRRATFGMAGRFYPKADWLPRPLRAKRTLQNLADDDAGAHLRSVALAGGELPSRLLAGDLQHELADYDPFTRGRDLFSRCGSNKLLNRLLYLDMKTLLADEILTKVDRTSMAVGLEVRVPMLDHRLVELSARLPLSLKLADGQGKRVLRQTVERWIGGSFAQTPKHGFDVPTDAWFRGPLREAMCDCLLSRHAMCRTWLNMPSVNRMLGDHIRGRRHNGPALWALFMLERWAQTGNIEPASGTEIPLCQMDYAMG